jgi:hypothetical protein
MKLFLSIAAVLAWLIGGALLLAPAAFYQPTGMALTPLLATIAQAHGATLVGLGVINWLTRGAEPAHARAVLAGNLVVQVLSLGVALRIMSLVGPAAAPSIAIHVTLGSLFGFFLARARRRPA